MTYDLECPGIEHSRLDGHRVASVVANNEPDSQRRRARGDLASAIPSVEAFSRSGAKVASIATTPDFHPGKPVPVGVVVDVEGGVLPHLIGNDIGCGMRMVVLDGVDPSELDTPELERHLRHVYFQGGRDVSLSGRSRHAVLRDGIPGLLESLEHGRKGLLDKLDLDRCWKDLEAVSDMGRFECDGVDDDFLDYADPAGGWRHDAILGSIGGGNHFVEFGTVDRIADGGIARTTGISNRSLVLVVHSGSLDFGQRVGSTTRSRLLARKGSVVDHRILSFERDRSEVGRFSRGQANAANAAFVNRFLIGLQAVEALERTIGRRVEHDLVYDAPHNVAWFSNGVVRHRKGACSAGGPDALGRGRYGWMGEPVILPGSMGDGTWLLAGTGNASMLSSSAHGAGRKLSRQEARRSSGGELSRLRVVGPVDLGSQQVKGRKDLLDEAMGRLKEEAPSAYRSIDDVVDAMVGAGMVRKGVKVKPLLTVKG